MSKWYKLDNAAKLFPTVTSASYSSVFRIAAVLTEAVDPSALQRAADHIFDRFPMMFLKLRRGVFWNYFDAHRDKFTVREETDFPCAAIHPHENDGYLFKVLWHGHRVSVEMFHSLTDGSGSMEFLKSLLFYYFAFTGQGVDGEGKVLLAEEGASAGEFADSFARNYAPLPKGWRQTVKAERSFRVRGRPFEVYGSNVITGVTSAGAVLGLARAGGATLTSYLAALLIESIWAEQQKFASSQAPIVVAVPVNLRRMFPSGTLRNFFAVANVGMRVNSATSFGDIVSKITLQLREKTQKPALSAFIAENVSLERKLYSRFTPLMIKKALLMIGTDLRGESRKTISLSNLGNVPIPSGFLNKISHTEMVLYPTPKSPVNCAVCSLGDRLSISFSRTIAQTDIIRRFFGRLSELCGERIEIYSNDWGWGRA